ncbi:hypothetical protein PDIDSM_2217 [Penicillium digitatum]|nr:hypothetical protein PDIDSM_2217 [Penicillium digitatum]
MDNITSSMNKVALASGTYIVYLVKQECKSSASKGSLAIVVHTDNCQIRGEIRFIASGNTSTSGLSHQYAEAFAAYLAYLYSYWKTPEYSQFLTHPGPTRRELRLLQEDTFRRDIILPQVIEGLAGVSVSEPAQTETETADETKEDGQNGKT